MLLEFAIRRDSLIGGSYRGRRKTNDDHSDTLTYVTKQRDVRKTLATKIVYATVDAVQGRIKEPRKSGKSIAEKS